MEILEANTPEQIAVIRTLFEEYAAWLSIDLCFQGFSAELAGLPGLYAAPRGRLFLAMEINEPAGCVALRPRNDTVCELKRMYVRPAFQRRGLGRQLAQRIVREARTIGYAKVQLDTLSHMQPAIRLYEAIGFVRCAAYYETPVPETVFMELHL